jgi:hypothetical protein
MHVADGEDVMKTAARAFALAVAVWALSPAPVDAQTIGTFRWQLQPYCNLITVVVTQVGSVSRSKAATTSAVRRNTRR